MTTARRAGSLLLSLFGLAAGCGGALDTPRCQDGSCGSQTSTKVTTQYSADRRVDLLFVVDDTPAIAPFADRVAAGFSDMAAALRDALLPTSLHVGFVRAGSCDTSTRARACGVTAPAQFVAMKPCNVVTNASGAFVDTVACLGALGDSDCAPNQPIAAALKTLDPANPSWAGFSRPDAYLMVIIVAATDDASQSLGGPTSVIDVAKQLKALKADPSQVMLTVIGPGDGTGDILASPLAQLANQFGADGLYLNFSADPLGYAVSRLTEVSNVGALPPCLTNVLDTDAATPGLQASCTVVQRSTEIDTGTSVEQKIPSCDDGPPPCWEQPRAGSCGAQRGWVVNVDGPLDQCVDGSISFEVECLGCADPNDPACALPQ